MKTAIQPLFLKIAKLSRRKMEESLLDKVTKGFPKRGKTCVKNILILAQGIILKETVCLNKVKGAVGAITGKTSTKPDYSYSISLFSKDVL
jgi:hypothetical protein